MDKLKKQRKILARYALQMGMEVLRPVCDMWSQKKKRPVRMVRYDKVSKYFRRSRLGKNQDRPQGCGVLE